MDNEARLMRVLNAPVAPARDPAFALAVMREAEARQFKADALRRMLQGGALAGAGAVFILPMAGWAVAHADALQNGLLVAAALMTLVATARLMAQRTSAAWNR